MRRALKAWQTTWIGAHQSGGGQWVWPSLVERLPRRAAVLPVAIWYGADLCGLALGYASRHRGSGVRHTISLTYVERRPEPPDVPLRGLVVPISVAVARNYGVTLGARRLRLRNPAPGLLSYYQALGFVVAWHGNHALYCEREITT